MLLLPFMPVISDAVNKSCMKDSELTSGVFHILTLEKADAALALVLAIASSRAKKAR